MTRGDRVALLEAAYAPAASSEAWLAGLVDAARSAVRDVTGAYAFRYDGWVAEAGHVDRVVASGVSREVLEAVMALRASNTTLSDAASFRLPPVHTATEMTLQGCEALGLDPGPAVEAVLTFSASLGYGDMIGVNALAPTGGGVYLALLTRGRARVAPQLRRSLARVAAHAVTSMRLARWQEASATDGAEAVLDPSGRVAHAEGPARAPSARHALADAVRAIERARGGLRRARPDEAVEIWRALVDGRWSVVDHVDRDGKRYLLARRNPPGAADPGALTEPERHVAALAAVGRANKLIAYELGIAESTVSTHLASALVKLRLRSRAELVRLLRPIGDDGGPPA